VRIVGDKGWAPNETFYIKIYPRTDYVSVKDTGLCTIINDDYR
jgi:hypothetical protein